MKNSFLKTLISFLLCTTFCLTADAQVNGRQGYVPTTNWPYLLEDFQKGVVVYNNDTVSMAKLNFHLRAQSLDCIDYNGKIARVSLSKFQCAIIDKEVYRFVNNMPMRQIYEEEDAMLMNHSYINYDVIDRGYNQGLALYARENMEVSVRANWNGHLNYANIHMPGEFNENYKELFLKRSDGQKLLINNVNYFVVKGKAFRAIPRECYDQLDKNAEKKLKAYIKAKNLKWKETEDQIAILQFLKQLI